MRQSQDRRGAEIHDAVRLGDQIAPGFGSFAIAAERDHAFGCPRSMHLSFTSNDVQWDRFSGRRNSVANMVNRILKGEKPGEIPIF
jgi:hypothetical protein